MGELPSWSSDYGSTLSTQGVWVPSLVREQDPPAYHNSDPVWSNKESKIINLK